MKHTFRLAAVATGLVLGIIMWLLAPCAHAVIADATDCQWIEKSAWDRIN
jgi:hypothetical protein